jgi:RNA polymerase sigma-70 factor (ECF subfamily)
VARARKRLAEEPIAEPSRTTRTSELGRRFLVALGRGDVPTLMAALDASAVMLSDGGGRVVAAINPIRGRDRIGRLIAGLVAKQYEALSVHDITINGAPGLWLKRADGSPYAVIGLGFSADGERVAAIYAMRNPDKLRRMPYTAR